MASTALVLWERRNSEERFLEKLFRYSLRVEYLDVQWFPSPKREIKVTTCSQWGFLGSYRELLFPPGERFYPRVLFPSEEPFFHPPRFSHTFVPFNRLVEPDNDIERLTTLVSRWINRIGEGNPIREPSEDDGYYSSHEE
jgi:hypothetical protein